MNPSRVTAGRYAAAVMAVMALALALRLHNVDSRSLWFDEAFSWRLADRTSPIEMVERTALDVHPPLYYAALRIWISIFGASVISMRGMSIAFALATILLLFFFCRDCFGRFDEDAARRTHDGLDAGVFAAGACAVSAYHIHWSDETRMYTLATTLAVASSWALLRAVQRPELLRRWTYYAAAAAALLYTHNSGLFTVFAQGVYCLVWLSLRLRSAGGLSRSREIWNVSAAFAFIAWAYAPWIPVLLFQKAQVQENYWIGSVEWSTVPACWFQIFFPDIDLGISRQPVSVGLAALLLLGLAAFARWHDPRRNLVLVLIVVPVLSTVGVSLVSVSVTETRHFLLAYMFVLCAIAALITDAFVGAPRWIAFMILVIAGASVHINYQSNYDSLRQPGMRGVVAALLESHRPGEPIVVRHPCVYFPAEYYLQGVAEPRLYLPSGKTLHFTGGPILRRSDLVDWDDLNSAKSDRLWVIDTTGFNRRGFRYSLPPEWTPIPGSRQNFRDSYNFQGDILLTLYERSQGSVDADETASLTENPETPEAQ